MAVLRVVAGPMCSGKTDHLIEQVHRAALGKKYTGKSPLCIKLNEDTASPGFSSRTGREVLDVVTFDPAMSIPKDAGHVFVDELQLIDRTDRDGLVENLVLAALAAGCSVDIYGLDMDFRGVPFDNMARMMAMADGVVKLKAICSKCGGLATHTQRLVDGQPASYHDQRIIVKGQQGVEYEPRCRQCHEVRR